MEIAALGSFMIDWSISSQNTLNLTHCSVLFNLMQPDDLWYMKKWKRADH
jgi:hypothetical protein